MKIFIIKAISYLKKIKHYLFLLKYLPLFWRQKRAWIKQGGKITHNYRILSDYSENAGSAKGHYFHQDLLVASFIFKKSPKRHVDIGSRVDGFIAHVASFRKIEVLDIRPMEKSKHNNITYIQADLMNSQNISKTDSLSCLHAIEHFGLGRYTDPINVNGHIDGIINLINLVKSGGSLYISFPIADQDEVYFNAHRILNPKTILNIPEVKKNLILERFDYVDNYGEIHMNIDIEDIEEGLNFGCGIYSFIKK